ncbi:MAG: hypothetical protein JSV74_01270, partial [Dehalococcoidia bacterium]
MKLRDLLEQLEQGEFRLYALGGANQSGFEEHDYPKIIPHINLALTELHKRFLMKSNTVPVQLYSQIARYHMHSDYARSNTASTKTPKYIVDTEFDPFNEWFFLKTERVFSEQGEEYPLNDDSETYSVYTPADNIVQVPFADDSNAISVEYRANHPKLVSTGEYILDQTVDISPTYLESLLLYISARYLSTQGTPELVQEGNNALQKFELSIRNIQNLGLDVREHTTHTKLEERGWV